MATDSEKAMLLIEDLINKQVTTLTNDDITLITNFMNQTADELIQAHPDIFTDNIRSTFDGIRNSLITLNAPAPIAAYNSPQDLDMDSIINYTTDELYKDNVFETQPNFQ